MEISQVRESPYYLISVEGDLDASSSIQLDDAIRIALSEGETKLLIDCEKLAYISSAGLGVFVSYLQEFKEKGRALVLFNLSDRVFNVFEILGLDQMLRIVDNLSEAKAEANEV